MKWLEVLIKTKAENEDIVSDILYSAGASGLAIEDPLDIVEFQKGEKDWDFIDASLLQNNMEGIIIKAYFAETDDLPEKIKFIKHGIEIGPAIIKEEPFGEVIINQVDDSDWAENWKKYYKPKRIGERIVIKPSWEHYEEQPRDLIVELDPGMAFGTGTHETTIMCTEALEAFVKPSSIVFDVGCGSGILSIVAAKLGASKVTAIDFDELCVRVTKENAEINNVSHLIDVKGGNLLDVIKGKADIVVANIVAEVIVILTKDLEEFLEPNGIFITSGIIIEKIPMVEAALTQNNFSIIEIKKMNSWACIVASKN